MVTVNRPCIVKLPLYPKVTLHRPDTSTRIAKLSQPIASCPINHLQRTPTITSSKDNTVSPAAQRSSTSEHVFPYRPLTQPFPSPISSPPSPPLSPPLSLNLRPPTLPAHPIQCPAPAPSPTRPSKVSRPLPSPPPPSRPSPLSNPPSHSSPRLPPPGGTRPRRARRRRRLRLVRPGGRGRHHPLALERHHPGPDKHRLREPHLHALPLVRRRVPARAAPAQIRHQSQPQLRREEHGRRRPFPLLRPQELEQELRHRDGAARAPKRDGLQPQPPPPPARRGRQVLARRPPAPRWHALRERTCQLSSPCLEAARGALRG